MMKEQMMYGPATDPTLGNFLIDAADGFANATAPGGAWLIANDLVKQIGGTAINMGSFSGTSLLPHWARSSISKGWTDEYIGNGYFDIDPFMMGRVHGEIPRFYVAGNQERDACQDPRTWKMNHGLLAQGYRFMACTATADPVAEGQRLVVLATDLRPDDFLVQPRIAAMPVLAALIAAHVHAPNTRDGSGMVAIGYQVLSPRERDVLSHLARGLNTGRIAERLGLAEVTVRKHFASARRKMGASSREQALALALVRGQIDL